MKQLATSQSVASCPHCSATLPAGASRCAYCGSAVTTPSDRSVVSASYPGETSSAHPMPASLPPELARLQAPPAQPRGERGRVVLLGIFLLLHLLMLLPVFLFLTPSEGDIPLSPTAGGLILLLLLIVLALAGYWISGRLQRRRLQREGRLTQAIVFKKWIDTDSDGDSSHYVAYAFHADVPGKGVELIARTELSMELYQQASVGGTLMVRYLPDDPKYCFVEAPAASPAAHN